MRAYVRACVRVCSAGEVRGVNAWCLRSVDFVHVVADQEHSDRTVPLQDGTGMNICSADCACIYSLATVMYFNENPYEKKNS